MLTSSFVKLPGIILDAVTVCRSVFLSGRNVTPTLKAIGCRGTLPGTTEWDTGIVSSTDIVYHCFIVTSSTGIVSS